MKLTPEQRKVAQTVINVGKRRGATAKEIKAAIQTILVESNARHLNYGDRDSVGAFQQRPSQGWGPAGESVAKDAAQFFAAARKANKSGGSAGKLAQAVQRSAFPERYDQRSGDAEAILAALGGATGGSASTADGELDRQAVAAYLLNRNKPEGRAMLLQLMAQRREGATSPEAAPTQGRNPTRYGKTGNLLELFYDPKGGIKHGKQIGAIGGHSDHVHVAVPQSQLSRVAKLAKRKGLTITSTSGGKHTAGSYHYRNQAVDVAGDPKAMSAFYDTVRRVYGTR